jgi:hypothetical protein
MTSRSATAAPGHICELLDKTAKKKKTQEAKKKKKKKLNPAESGGKEIGESEKISKIPRTPTERSKWDTSLL